MPAPDTARESFLAEYDRAGRDLPGAGRSWAATRRRAGRDRFAALGLPAAHLEDWRFTSVASIAARAWQSAPVPSAPAQSAVGAALGPDRLTRAEAIDLVFVDGHFAPSLSQLFGLPEGVRIGSLGRMLEEDSGWARSERLEGALGSTADGGDASFTDLNLALFRDGAFVSIAAGVVFPRPIHLLFVSTAAPRAAATVVHPRNLILLGERAQATVIESYLGARGAASGPDPGAADPDTPTLTNAVSELVLDEGAVLEHVRIQDQGLADFHIATVGARLAASAELRSLSFALGGALSRVEVAATQDGPGTRISLDGLYLLDGDQHSDNRTTIDHAHPHGSSTQLYKGILGGRSRGVFNGRVRVREGAQKTDARQINRNLLLSEETRIDTKPELLISADDVKCSHGATIGQIDENAVFYLRSRGLDPSAARSLLIWAFASEVVRRVPLDPLRTHIQGRLLARLPGGGDFLEAV